MELYVRKRKTYWWLIFPNSNGTTANKRGSNCAEIWFNAGGDSNSAGSALSSSCRIILIKNSSLCHSLGPTYLAIWLTSCWWYLWSYISETMLIIWYIWGGCVWGYRVICQLYFSLWVLEPRMTHQSAHQLAGWLNRLSGYLKRPSPKWGRKSQKILQDQDYGWNRKGYY